MGSDLGVRGYSAINEDSNKEVLFDYPWDKVETSYVNIKINAFPMNLHKFLDNAGYKEVKRGKDQEGYIVHTKEVTQWLTKERYEKLVNYKIVGEYSGDALYHLDKY